MKIMSRFNFCTIFFLTVSRIYSQDPALPDAISSIAEELAENESNPEAAESFYDLLSELSEDPVRINTDDLSELSRLFFLTGFQVRSLTEHFRTSGKIVSIYEIADIPGFDRETVLKMAPFITLVAGRSAGNGSGRFTNAIISNLSMKAPGKDTSFAGSPLRHLVKYKFTSGSITGGFTAEKDAGESFLDHNNSLPDFFSANFSYSGNGIIRKVIIGDYGACFGLGTAVNTGIRTGLSLTSLMNLSGRNEFRPYTSTDENNFFRGMATQIRLGAIETNVYYSSNRIDGAIYMTGPENRAIASLYSTGLHNTPSSLLKKDALRENSMGINLICRLKNLNAGLTYAYTGLSVPLEASLSDPSDIYSFTGDRNRIISANYSGLLNRIILSGEITSDSRGMIAFVQAVTMRMSDRFTASMLYRRSQPGYTAFHSNGPGSSSSGDNQEGFLGTFTFEAARFLFISGGCDLRYFPWMKYRCSAPSHSVRKELRIKYLPSDRFLAEILYTRKYSMTDRNESYGITKQDENYIRSVKFYLKYFPVERLSVGTRFDINSGSSGTSGMLLMQDIYYGLPGLPVTIWFRHSVYNISGWLSRIYTYENDLLYSFSIPALSGTGNRSYLMASVKVKELGEFRVKYGITANRKSPEDQAYSQELKMQLRLRF